MVCAQQLIAMMALFKIAVPANLSGFFRMIMKISSFNLVNLNGAIDGMLKLNSEPFNHNFD